MNLTALALSGYTLILLLVILFYHRAQRAERLELLETNIHTAQMIGHAVALRDHDTGSHNFRVAYYACRLGEALGLDHGHMQALMKGAFLHDIGKIGIPDAILLSPRPLSEKEFGIMRRHVDLGVELVRGISWFYDALDVIHHHHERFDGSGYPDGLRGMAIPLHARIFTVVDVFDALTSERPYKPAFSYSEAVQFLQDQSGAFFDPDIIRTFLPLSKGLYDEVCQLDTDEVRARLEDRRRDYFGV